MDKKFDIELQKIEKLLDKVDNDLLKQGIKSDFSIFFKNMDKTFEIYNVCLEEICGQLYLLDLIFHSKVIRKLFHNYKHQLHNIMKFQLNIQKDLNLKHQEEKNLKEKIGKLEENIKILNEEKGNLEDDLNNEQNKTLKLKNEIEKLNETIVDLKYKEKELLEEKKKIEIIKIQQEEMLKFDELKNKKNDEAENDDEFKKQIQDLLSSKENNYTEGSNLKTQLLGFLNNMENQKIKFQQEMESGNLNRVVEEDEPVYFEKNNLNSQISNHKINPKIKKFKIIHTNNYTYYYETSNYKNNSNNQNMKEMENMILGYEKKINVFSKKNQELNNSLKSKEREIQLLNDQINVNLEDGYDEKAIKRENLGLLKDIEELNQQNEYLDKEYNKFKNLYQNLIKKRNNNENIEISNSEIKSEKSIENDNIQDDIVSIDNNDNINDPPIENIEKTDNINININDNKLEDNKPIDNVKKDKSVVLDKNNKSLNKITKIKKKPLDSKKVTKKPEKKILKPEEKCNNTSKNIIDKKAPNTTPNKENLELISQLKKNLEKNKKDIDRLNLEIEKLNSQNMKVLDDKTKIEGLYNDILQKELNDNDKVNFIFNQQNLRVDDLVNKLDSMEQIKYKLLEEIQNAKDEINFYKDNCTNKNNEIENLKNKINIISKEFLKSEDKVKFENRIKIEEEKQNNVIKKKPNINDFKDENSLVKSDKEEIKKMLDEFNMINTKREIQTVVRGIQTDYSSPIKFILQNKEIVQQKDCTNFELIKKCADFLAELVGYEDIDDGYNENSDIEEEQINMIMKPQEEFVNTPKNKSKKKNISKEKKNKLSKDKNKIVKIDNKEKDKSKAKKMKILKKNLNKFKIEKKDEVQPKESGKIIKHRTKSKPKKSSDSEEIDVSSDSSIDNKISKFKIKKKLKQKSKDKFKSKVIENEAIHEELMTNLKVSNKIHSQLVKREESDENSVFSHEIKNNEKYMEWSMQKREREKVLFRIYVNLKKRYKFKPEKFLKIFKLYFSKEPPFFDKYNEDSYDPQGFLFNFEEFKEYYSELTKIHTKCGDECQHLKRFYEGTGIIKKNQNKKLVKMNKILIHKLPDNKQTRKFLLEKYIKKYYYK